MVAKRVIPCLDVKDGRTVKGVNFVSLRDAGDAVELAQSYAREGADELVFLDITATVERRKTICDLVSRVSEVIDIPFTVGGGIKEIADVEALLESGADKVSINSAAVRRPELISELAKRFGSQCVVLAVDVKAVGPNEQDPIVVLDGGRTPTEHRAFDWIKDGVSRGAGEILLTSMDHDGAKSGFATTFTAAVSDSISVPVIASGGAGCKEHFLELFRTSVDAGLAASIFHFAEVRISDLKRYLQGEGIEVRV